MLTDEQLKGVLAANVNRLLGEMGKSRYWLAKQTGESETRIANVCRAINCCSAGLLTRIAEALGTSTDALIEPIKPARKPTSSKKMSKSA